MSPISSSSRGFLRLSRYRERPSHGAELSREGAGRGKDGAEEGIFSGPGSRERFQCCPSPQLTDDVKKEKEKEPEKLDKLENSTVPKKKGFEEEHKDSDDDSSDDEQVRPPTAFRVTSTWGASSEGPR